MKHKLVTDLPKLEKIIHLADIHIRLYKRHAEYKEVFDKLYADIRGRDLKNTAIVVAGDIVHSKTDMSPEMVKVTSEFLKTLADIAPTIVIAGNHDLNLANPNRLDALSPIVNNLQHKQLYYLKDAGVYQFADVELGVHAIDEDVENWPVASELSDKKPRIALYHGPVNKAQTDVGYTVTNRITVETFKGYDMVLLGDIHKTQFLQEYGGAGVPEIFYPGSLIQQNHGEALKGHGYAVWDVTTRKVETYVEVKNSYGYHTLKLTDTKMPDISNLPDNIRLRILVGAVDNTLVKKVQAAVRKKYNVVECTVNRLVEKKSSTNKNNTSVLDNINDVSHQNSLIKEYIEENYADADPDILQKVLEINTTLNTRIGDDELPKNISWRPLHIKFDNLFSYGEGNSINFDGMEGLYGVFSPNATGKTSAFDAMCFALYDKTPRAFKGSHIMNTRKDKFSCELTIEIGKKQYVIERVGNRKKNGEVKVDVNFFRLDGEDKISLNGEDRRDTNATIRSYVGTYEDFVLTSLSVQGQNSLFIETGQSDRKDLLSQFIGLTVFDRLYNLASDEIKELTGALKSFKRDDFTQKLADAQNKIESELSHCETITADIAEFVQRSEVLSENIKSLYAQKNPSVTDIDVSSLSEELEKCKETIAQLEKSIEERNEKIAKTKTDHKALLDKLPKKSVDELSTIFNEVVVARTAMSKLQSDMRILRADAENKRDKLEKLKEHKYDPNCDFCINNVFVKDAQATRSQYDSLLAQIDAYEEKLNGADEYIAARSQAEEEYKTAIKLRDDIHRLENQMQVLILQNSGDEKSIETNNGQIMHYETVITQYQVNKNAVDENIRLQSEIDKMEDIKKAFDSDVRRLEQAFRMHDRNVSLYRKEKDDMMKSIKDAEELETTYEAYETYLAVIGRDGLPYALISQVIPTLQTEVNNVLSQTSDFSVSLEVDGKNINGKILYEDDRVWPLELASGMEKFVSGLALRVALMSVSNLPKSNFLVIDEGLGVLDADNLANMSTLFGVLKGQFDFIILISHLDVVRDIADNLIDIQRENGYSKITVE
jgi:DNA repair exonuclease SbcCD ATPase subunit/DNA repair exonuclease SbcCD nuclease subunit